jgi:hypothetical protein
VAEVKTSDITIPLKSSYHQQNRWLWQNLIIFLQLVYAYVYKSGVYCNMRVQSQNWGPEGTSKTTGKHVSVTRNTHCNNGGIVWCCGFYVVHAEAIYGVTLRLLQFGGKLNTSTEALRVIRGNEMGRFKSETVKYGHESHRTQTRKWLHCRGLAAIVNNKPVLSSETVVLINRPVTVIQ